MSHNMVVLLLGSNLGDKRKNIDTAIGMLEEAGCVLTKKTEYLYNEAVDFHSSNSFCNIALEISTLYSPMELLSLAKRIEKVMGREKDSVQLGGYTDRCIDIDIVLYNGLSFKCKKIEIPHPRNLYEREFSRKLIEELKKIE